MTAKTLLVAVLALFPVAAASAAKPMSGEVAVISGYGASSQRGNLRQMVDRTKSSMSSHIRGLMRRANGTPIGEGHGGAAHASLFVPLPQGARVRMVKAGSYHGAGGESGPEIQIDGVDRDQDLELTLVGQTSVHDLGSEAQLNSRIATDHLGIKIDGVLKHSSLSGDAGEGTVKLPWGTKSVQYVRLSGPSGYEVGGVSGYPAGRDFKLSWGAPSGQ